MNRLESIGAPRGPARILVVDDDAFLGNAIRRIFRGVYEIELTSSSTQALALFQAGARFDAILCDVRMPQRNGRELYEELSRSLPDQAARIIFMTGALLTDWVPEFLRGVPNPHLEKPFEPEALERLLAERLSRA
jgi:two-component system NtrC family sensor kinase